MKAQIEQSYKKVLLNFKLFIKAVKISISIREKKSSIIAIIGFPMAFIPALISIILRQFTDEIQAISGIGKQHINMAFIYFILLSLMYVIQTIYGSLQSYYSNIDSLNIQEYIKETIMQYACNVKFKYIDNYDDFLNKIAFAKTDSGYRVANSIENIIRWFQNLLTFISLLVVILNVNILIVLVLLITSIPSVILANMQKDEDYRRKTKWMKEGALVIHQFQDCCAQYSLNEVRYLGIFNYLKEKWRKSADTYISLKNKMTRKHVAYNTIADLLRNGVFVVILLITAKEIFLNPNIGLGVFMLILSVAEQFQTVTTKLFVGMSQFLSDMLYIKDFFELENLEFEDLSDIEEIENVDINFDNVSFSYPGSNYYQLQSINIKIGFGEKIAIVGENGSGKTTFINLLLGLYEPCNGTVSVGGRRVHDSLHNTRKNLSVIFQNFGKYEMSLRDNIIISDMGKIVDDSFIMKLANSIDAYDVIQRQREGLNEIIGSLSEKGNNLSGGQWQKVAILRAAYKNNAKIMILDEPTAALDPLAESEIYQNFFKLTGNRTTIFVSHRLGITSLVDRILVFGDGGILEDGTHTELMKKDGIYAKMYKAQAQWYK